MSRPELEPIDPPSSAAEGAPEPGETALFAGDRGALAFDTRRALCQLLLGPCIDAQRHAQLWKVVERDEALLQARLSELFLELVLDRDLRVAFTRQADTGELEAPILLRSSPLTFVDSVLLLNLRQRLSEADALGSRAVVEEADLQEQLAVYQRIGITDRAGFAKRVAASIEKMKKNSVLQKLRGSEDRYEISPTLKLLFSAEAVHALQAAYRSRLEAEIGPDTSETGSAEAEDE